jgi:uncharacterized RDD family membrane protein YckC
MEKAVKSKRLLNFLIDSFIVSIIAVILTQLILYAVLYLLKFEILHLEEFEIHSGQIFIPAFIVYYFILEYFFSKTLAKFVTSTKVVKRFGIKPTGFDLFLRTLTRLIPFEFVLIFFENKCLHDYFSGTIVIESQVNSALPQV